VRRAALGCLLLALGAAALPAPAAAGEGIERLARAHAAPWPALQRPDGSFEDRLRRGRYGESMLGLSLLGTGLRAGDRRLVGAGLRGLGWVIDRPGLRDAHPSVFEHYAVAAGYNLARARLGADARFRALRPRWERWLRGVKPVLLGRRLPFHNHHLVEATAVLELTATGLTSGEPGSVLTDRVASHRQAAELVKRVVPRLSHGRSTRVPGGAAALLVDTPTGHLAYQGLSLGFYARALKLLGTAAGVEARATLRRAARASIALSAPDGDTAFVGRSQEQSWALTLTAFGALRAADGVRASERRELAALARRSLRRLELLHPVRSFGTAITPALGQDFEAARPGLDGYADGAGFSGLTLLGLLWAAEEPQPSFARAPARHGNALLKAGRGDLAVVRSPGMWWAVRRTADPRCGLRCDFGLVALKVRRGDGTFADVIRARPRAPGTAGPVLLRGRRRLEPAGVVMRRRGRSLIVGARLGRRYARFRFLPGRCGPVMSWPVRRGDLFEYSTYLPAGSRLRRRRDGLQGGGLRLRSRAQLRARATGERLVSGAEATLTRSRVLVRAGRSGALRIEHCPG
jgi:hypothetical protein